MNGHAQALAKAVLLYFGRDEGGSVMRQWRYMLGDASFSATTLCTLARRVLDKPAAAESKAKSSKGKGQTG